MPNLRIDAGPGCGKSHTLAVIPTYIRAKNVVQIENRATEEQLTIYRWCKENLPPSCYEKSGYYAYNKDIVQEMTPKVDKFTECKTSHGWGYKVVNQEYGYVPLNNRRSYLLVSQITGKQFNDLDNKERFKWLSVINFVTKLKEELMQPSYENFQRLKAKYVDLAAYSIFDGIEEYSNKLLQKMKVVDRKVGIEYVDQLWLAAFLIKRPILPLGLVDEDQDLSPLRLLVARLLFENIIFCGDENQSINMFAGADPESVNNIRKVVDLELPLKTTFRNTPEHCNYLNALIPSARLRPHPEKKNGLTARMMISELAPHLRRINTAGMPEVNPASTDPDDQKYLEFFTKHSLKQGLNEWGECLIVCRYNAPLVRVCTELIKANIPCYILGNTLIDDLVRIVEGRKATSMEELYEKLDRWQEICCRAVPDIIAMQIEDKVECIKLVASVCDHPDQIPSELKKMLKPKVATGLVRLSTIHRSKGLQAKHIFILFPPIEYPKAATDMEKKQEKNLHFVGFSRSSCNIYWVHEDD